MSVEVCAGESLGHDAKDPRQSEDQNRKKPLAYEDLWRPIDKQLEYVFREGEDIDRTLVFSPQIRT